MPRGMTEPLTRLQRIKFYLRSKLCSECKYSSYFGLKMCDKHNSKDWAKYEAMHPEWKINKEKYDQERLRKSMGKVMLEQTKSGKGFVKPEHFKLFPFLTFLDKLKLLSFPLFKLKLKIYDTFVSLRSYLYKDIKSGPGKIKPTKRIWFFHK